MNPVHQRLTSLRAAGEKIAALTAYDYPSARLLDGAGVDLILVGDSLGMVVLGYEDTTSVTMADMLHHTRAVRRATSNAILVADLPFASYETPGTALSNAQLLVEAGAEAVKLEGATPHLDAIRTIIGAGIPFVGHLGMLPQHVRDEGGYRKKGKTPEGAIRLIQDAKDLQQAGASAIVLESMVASVADQITAAVDIPTIGIGAGPNTAGQILVTHDLIGAFPWFCPSFAPTYTHTAQATTTAVKRWVAEVKG
ncbi:MAG: 3-methyl-2-oxobutanoate hydroxymethyltransferase [Verrucomicrobiales bacterium]|nr:3-methyl-2-oxobutanoate hydroxymethyltransferase [Verrucomicrobiales bacterium]